MAHNHFVALLVLLSLVSGCALTSKGKALSPRYYSVDVPGGARGQSEPASADRLPLELRLGRVEGASHLEERIVFRNEGSELGYYEERRWTEEPQEFLRRALARELFERRSVQRVVAGPAPTLEVELTAFEDVKKPRRLARLSLVYVLHDERAVLLEKTLTIERSVVANAGTDVAPVVDALGAALGEAVAEIAERVTHELRRERPPDQPAAASTASPE
jgi:cholesterol transport system auxiliary component